MLVLVSVKVWPTVLASRIVLFWSVRTSASLITSTTRSLALVTGFSTMSPTWTGGIAGGAGIGAAIALANAMRDTLTWAAAVVAQAAVPMASSRPMRFSCRASVPNSLRSAWRGRRGVPAPAMRSRNRSSACDSAADRSASRERTAPISEMKSDRCARLSRSASTASPVASTSAASRASRTASVRRTIVIPPKYL
jgi:hypothetical protein